jgi:hypothetical protein
LLSSDAGLVKQHSLSRDGTPLRSHGSEHARDVVVDRRRLAGDH